MTKAEIITAAFRVWGETLYKNTSLSQLAQYLGVTKAALYRHFRNKQALLDGMSESFLDEYYAHILPAYHQAAAKADRNEQLLALTESIIAFYCANPNAFIFSLFQVFQNNTTDQLFSQLKKRGMDMEILVSRFPGDAHPSLLQLSFATLSFWLAFFHRFDARNTLQAGDEDIQRVVTSIQRRIAHGLGIAPTPNKGMDFARLDAAVFAGPAIPPGDAGLLKAVAETVAEAGPWKASMKRIAARTGLSKSSLYAHFSSKREMISQFFVTEIERIASYIEMIMQKSPDPQEQLYLFILAIGNYLRGRPEILKALNWLRIHRVDFDIPLPTSIFLQFNDIQKRLNIAFADEIEANRNVQWILFLVIHTMMQQCSADAARRDAYSFRALYRYIAFGVADFPMDMPPKDAFMGAAFFADQSAPTVEDQSKSARGEAPTAEVGLMQSTALSR